jgi:hypothetical protein
LAARVDFAELDDVPSFAEYGTEVFPEATEIVVKFHKDQHAMDQYVQFMLDNLQRTGDGGWELDYGINDPVSVQTTWNSQQVRRILDEQRSEGLGSVSPDTLSVTKGPQDIGITVKSNSSEESDLQYVIYVQFLAEIPDPALLEITGRLFTAHVLSMLESKKTVRFDFKISGASLSSILSSPTNITVGALHSSEDGSERRITPLRKHDIGILPNTICEQFAVVLDKPAFVTEPGVLFFMNDVRPDDVRDQGCPIAEVRRSAGMSEVARRLAMLALDENRGRSPKRSVTKEECLSLLGLSLEQYQSALFAVQQD